MVDTIRIDQVTDPLAVVPQSRVITAGTGLDGGGNLSADRTIALNAASIASLAKADASALAAGPTFTGQAKFPTGSAAAPSITHTSDIDTGVYFGTDIVNFVTAGVFAGMFDASQRFVVGHTAAVAIGANSPRFQTHGTDQMTALNAYFRWSADSGAASLIMAKSRNATPGSHTIVQNGDLLASMAGYGSDGAAFINGGGFRVTVDGTPGLNDMPTKASIFTTADGASSPTERVKVDPAGMMTALFGITTAAGTTAIAPLNFTAGTNLASVTAGAWEYDGAALYFAHAASSRGVVAVRQIATVQGSKVSLNNASTGAQNVFAGANDALTVKANTTYRVRGKIQLNTGSTSHTTSFGLGGTATFTGAHLNYMSTSSAADTLATPQMRRASVATAVAVTAASGAVTTDIWIEGIIRIANAGTIIPQITFSAGPTGTCEVELDSFFELEPIGSDTVAAVGNWA